MRSLRPISNLVFLFLALIGLALPAAAAKRVTVEQLAQIVATGRIQPDASFAQKLIELELTERLSQETLSHWQIESLGPAARQAIAILADESSFLDLPPAELPVTPTPDIPTQRRILAQTVNYVSKTIRQLPNFFANRITTRYEDSPLQQAATPQQKTIGYKPLHLLAKFTTPVVYRDGQEIADLGHSRGKKSGASLQGLSSWGEFGPVLSTVFVDAAQNQMSWSHWENDGNRKLAVFQYKVPQNRSHYQVSYCCGLNGPLHAANGLLPPETHPFQRMAGYHGTISIDPSNGVILRLTVEADLKVDDPISVAEIMVKYDSVEIGGDKYVCPVKSLALSLSQDQEVSTISPIKRSLNVTEFSDYHQFRATTRLLAEGTQKQETQPPVASITKSENLDTEVPSASAPAESEPGSAGASVARNDSTTTTQLATSAPSEPLPMPANVSTESEQESLLREMPVYKTYAREVVVDVVVTKGNDDPILGLHKQDFVVMEDGKPQTIDFFEEHTAKTLPPGAQQPLPNMPSNMYTNVPSAPESDAVNVLLLDSLNTPRQDQSRVHLEIMDFIKKMQPDTRVAIFMLGSKLRFVQGFTTDTSVLLAALKDKRNSTPQKEAASRDRSDTADDAADVARLQMMQASPAGIEALKDAQADNKNFAQAARVSMTFEALNYIARYLASVPGRKNLIWFSSSFPIVIFPAVTQREGMEHSEGHGLLDRVRKTANLFTISKVAVYPVSAEGMMDEHISEADNAGPAAPGGVGHIGSEMDTMAPYNGGAGARANTIAAMEQLAADTGGKAYFNTNDLNGAMRRAINDGAHYYTLTYSPTNKKMDGTYRRIELKLNEGHYKLAYRRGYNAEDAPFLEAKSDVDPLQPLMKFGLPSATGLLYGVRVLAAIPQPASDAPRAGQSHSLKGPFTRYSVEFLIHSTDITFEPNPQGEHSGKIQVALMAYDHAGNAVNWTAATLAMNIKADAFDAIQKSGVPAHFEIDLPDEDAYLVTGVYDWATGRAGTLEIPLHPTAITAAPITPTSQETK